MQPDIFIETLTAAGRALLDWPWYAYAGAVLFLSVVFGKKREWEFEAKLIPEGSNDIAGKLEIKKFKNRPPVGSLSLYRSDGLRLQGLVEVFVNDRAVSRIELQDRSHRIMIHYPHVMKNGRPVVEMFWPAKKKRWNKLEIPLDARQRPENNDAVRVEINGETTLKGILLRD